MLETQEARLEWLIKRLLQEVEENPSMKKSFSFRSVFGGDTRAQANTKTVLRGLMNIRAPKPISKDWLEVQDAYLKQDILNKGIVDVTELPTLKEQYHSMHPFAETIAIWQGDITRLKVGAIVNAANSHLLGCFAPNHGCIDNAIHFWAGLELREACEWYMRSQRSQHSYYEEPTGKAVLTEAYNLPSRYVLHTVGPIVTGTLTEDLKQELRACYRSCLETAIVYNIRSIAFPCISTGEFHFPNKEAAMIAVSEVMTVFNEKPNHFDKIIFNVFKPIDLEIYERILESI